MVVVEEVVVLDTMAREGLTEGVNFEKWIEGSVLKQIIGYLKDEHSRQMIYKLK